MNVYKRLEVYMKFNGKCAYTGMNLPDNWQIDHIIPKRIPLRSDHTIKSHDDFENLVPCLQIVNHYKRALSLDGFRKYMLDFHKRFAKLPKNTKSEKTKNRILYMNKVADAFGISPEKPFLGKFYFEIVNKKENKWNLKKYGL